MSASSSSNLFFEKLQSLIDSKKWIKLQLTAKRDGSSDLKKVIIFPVDIKKGYCLNFVYRHNTKDITKNYNAEEGFLLIIKLLKQDFLNAELQGVEESINLYMLPNGKSKLVTQPSTVSTPIAFSHDRIKERLIDIHDNVYLRELGITNANGELRREMSDKFKQINQYIELLAPNLATLSLPDQYQVVDMGSGKGYLTFALYDYLTNTLNHKVSMVGVEFREDLVNICNAIAQKAGFDGLNFVKGTIEKTELDKIDILIALHACNTATDDAIYRGIQAEAAMIVCAPCCHKQIRRDMNVGNALGSVLKYGILKERQSELLTDGLRAMIMEAYGYNTNVFEFISLEHTPKNVMIVGRKSPIDKVDKQKIISDISAIKQLFGIEKHYLETLLGM